MKIVFFPCVISCLAVFTGCVTLTTHDTVLQKSSETTPTWIHENGLINSTNPEYINLVFTKGDLYNLPLGIKQSQTIATTKISSLVLTEIQKQILQRFNELNLNHKNIPFNVVDLSVARVVNKFRSDFKVDKPLPEQVYWEYRQQERTHDAKQYYVVWVLLLVPKTVYDKALLTIAHELQNSQDEATVTLGNDILKQERR